MLDLYHPTSSDCDGRAGWEARRSLCACAGIRPIASAGRFGGPCPGETNDPRTPTVRCTHECSMQSIGAAYRRAGRVSERRHQGGRVSESHRRAGRVSELHHQGSRVSESHRQAGRVSERRHKGSRVSEPHRRAGRVCST